MAKTLFTMAGIEPDKARNIDTFVDLAYKQGKKWSRKELDGFKNDKTLAIEKQYELLMQRLAIDETVALD